MLIKCNEKGLELRKKINKDIDYDTILEKIKDMNPEYVDYINWKKLCGVADFTLDTFKLFIDRILVKNETMWKAQYRESSQEFREFFLNHEYSNDMLKFLSELALVPIKTKEEEDQTVEVDYIGDKEDVIPMDCGLDDSDDNEWDDEYETGPEGTEHIEIFKEYMINSSVPIYDIMELDDKLLENRTVLTSICTSIDIDSTFVEKFAEKITWEAISQNPLLSDGFLKAYTDKIVWRWQTMLIINKQRDYDFVERFKDKLDWSSLTNRVANRDEGFRNRFRELLDESQLFGVEGRPERPKRVVKTVRRV